MSSTFGIVVEIMLHDPKRLRGLGISTRLPFFCYITLTGNLFRMHLKPFILVILSLLAWTGSNVAQETITFRKTFGDTRLEFGHSVQQATDGGYILFGLTTNDSSFNYDLYLIHLLYCRENGIFYAQFTRLCLGHFHLSV